MVYVNTAVRSCPCLFFSSLKNHSSIIFLSEATAFQESFAFFPHFSQNREPQTKHYIHSEWKDYFHTSLLMSQLDTCLGLLWIFVVVFVLFFLFVFVIDLWNL